MSYSYNDIINDMWVFAFCCVLNIILLIIDGVVLLKTRKNKNKYEKHQYGISNFCFWAGLMGTIISVLVLLPYSIFERQLIEVMWYTFIPTYCYIFSLFIINNGNKLVNSLFVLWTTIGASLALGGITNILLLWARKPRLKASDWLLSLIIPLLCSSVSWIIGFKESKEHNEKSQRTLGDEIFNYVKSQNERGFYPKLDDINKVFGKNVFSNVNGQVDNYNDGDICTYERDSGVHKKGDKKPALEKTDKGYKAHGEFIKDNIN